MTELQPSATPEPQPMNRWKSCWVTRMLGIWAAPFLLAMMTFSVYWPARHCDFVSYDDPFHVTSNRHVRPGLTWSGFAWAFRTTETANWHPLTWLSHMADVSLFGSNPSGHHLMNVLFHSANVAVLFILLRELTGARWRSAFVAALFAVHPLNVESVAWIAERKDVLSVFFGLLTLLFYERYVRRRVRCQVSGVREEASEPRSEKPEAGSQEAEAGSQNAEVRSPIAGFQLLVSRQYWLALLFFTLGLMCKPMLVTLPFIMLLLDYWPLGRRREAEGRSTDFAIFSRLVFEKLPFFLLSVVFCVITFIAQKGNGAVVALTKISIGMRIENAFVSYGRYLGKLFWPVNLALPYPYPTEWPWLLVIFCGLLTIGLCMLAWLMGRNWPFIRTGWFWFFGTLIPVIGLVQVGNQPLADRYTYLPSIGFFILVVWGLWAVVEGFVGGNLGPNRPSKLGVVVVCGIVALVSLAACAWRTRIQLSYWKDSESLFRHAALVTKNNGTALDSLGLSLLNKGHLDAALECYNTALVINPKDTIALDGIGCCLFNKGQVDEAIRNFRKVLTIDTNQSATLFNLGSALAIQQHYDEAIPYFQASLRVEPNDPDTLRSLGNVYIRQGRLVEAANSYTAALMAAPEDVNAHRSLGLVLFNMGRLEDSGYQYTKVLQIAGPDADAHLMLARILESLGHRAEARVHVIVALKIKPDDAGAKQLLQALQN